MAGRETDTWVHPAACDRRHEELNGKLADLAQMLARLDARLYRDNGHRSIQSILRDHDRVIRIICWATSIVCGAILVGGVGMAWAVMRLLVNAGGM